jgi:hypothetical protein
MQRSFLAIIVQIWMVATAMTLGVGCSYTFTGAAIDPDVKTISIARVENNAPIVVPALSQEFTEALRDKFLSQTTLKLASASGDLQLAGAIVSYTINPLTVQSSDRAAQNRLSVSVRFKFDNIKHPEKSWEEGFEQFVDFPASQNNASAEANFRREVQEKLVQDIFNKALANW